MGTRTSELPTSARIEDSRTMAALWAAVAGSVMPVLMLLVSLGGLALSILSLGTNSLEASMSGCLLMLALCGTGTLLRVRTQYGGWRLRLILLSILPVAAALGLATLPAYVTAPGLDAVVHRSLFTALALMTVALFSSSTAIYYLLGATPRAEDASRYPLLLLPVAIAMVAYYIFARQLLTAGVADFDWQVLTRPYEISPVDRTDPAGLSSHILGTVLLMVMTSAFALPIAVGSGIYQSEYGDGRLARILKFSTSTLRAVSAFILALAAVLLVSSSANNFLSRAVWGNGNTDPTVAAVAKGLYEFVHDTIGGFYFDRAGIKHSAYGSFFTASLVLALLAIPVIARATEEGCRSLPKDVREGSWALGASAGYTLRRIVLPWAVPNIVTGLLLACAEVAGDVSVIMLIAGSGEYGVQPLRGVTSLAFMIYDSRYGRQTFSGPMEEYQHLAALALLALTMGMTVGAMVLKSRLNARTKGR